MKTCNYEEKEIKQLKVKDKWEKDFGILTFDIVKNKFHFKYDDNCNGYPFSDINIQNGSVNNVRIKNPNNPIQLIDGKLLVFKI